MAGGRGSRTYRALLTNCEMRGHHHAGPVSSSAKTTVPARDFGQARKAISSARPQQPGAKTLLLLLLPGNGVTDTCVEVRLVGHAGSGTTLPWNKGPAHPGRPRSLNCRSLSTCCPRPQDRAASPPTPVGWKMPGARLARSVLRLMPVGAAGQLCGSLHPRRRPVPTRLGVTAGVRAKVKWEDSGQALGPRVLWASRVPVTCAVAGSKHG